jgi:hypothetical protein
MGMIMFTTFFGYPLLLMYIFWRPYSRSSEYRRYEENRAKANENDGPSFRILRKSLVGLLIALGVLFLIALFVVRPLMCVNRISISGDKVTLDSLYWTWTISEHAIRNVLVIREEGAGRGGRYASYVADIILNDGTKFRTNEVIATPPGGNEDRRYRAYFAELRTALTN